MSVRTRARAHTHTHTRTGVHTQRRHHHMHPLSSLFYLTSADVDDCATPLLSWLLALKCLPCVSFHNISRSAENVQVMREHHSRHQIQTKLENGIGNRLGPLDLVRTAAACVCDDTHTHTHTHTHMRARYLHHFSFFPLLDADVAALLCRLSAGA